MEAKRLIVVLGMHRSGTSVVTRSLQVMGVELGDRMMPPVVGNNAKGFWEDIDLNALNIQMLDAIHSDWSHLTPIEVKDVEALRNEGYFLRAVELLRQKVGGVAVFAFKDPRVAKLLPFWKEVFKYCNYNVNYVLAVRHPLSVVKSLAKRDGIAEAQSYLLWLGYVITALMGSAGDKRVLVDYDRLMQSPDAELTRIANCIDLEIIPAELQSYKTEFLDQGLRHTIFELNDLLLDKACPPIVREVYDALLDVASGNVTLDDQTLQSKVSRWSDEFERLKSPLMLVDRLFTQKRIATQAVAERDEQIVNLSQAVTERDGQIASLNQAVSERDSQIVNLGLARSTCDADIAASRRQLNEVLLSNSWRVTKPLRVFGAIARRLFMPRQRTITKEMAITKVAPVFIDREFDRDFYLRTYPDIKAAGIDPEKHFRLYGMKEGRLGRARELDIRGSFDRFNSNHETILVVSHEASLTGAPILGLNLVQELAERYNVIALLLGPGAIEDAFESAGAVVVRASEARANPSMAELVIKSLLDRNTFKFALVNSIESRSVLPALARQHIPSISLIHEFAAYTRPKEAFREAIFWSGVSVFSSRITLESAQNALPETDGRTTYVLPQGRCNIPQQSLGMERLEMDRARILRTFRPQGIHEDVFIVLGAGFVQLRKGVDLFIECAARVIRFPGGERCRFVWIGAGFNADTDVNYSVYLADQIRRAGLEEFVFFLDETIAIESAYEEADILVLSSRLDPLPNVAIDAMDHALPVLCFDKASGIAEILSEAGLGQSCVADYLDTHDMANKILAMANSESLHAEVGARSRALARERFDMSTYVASLERLATDAQSRMLQERMDAEEITSSGRLRFDFVAPPHLKSKANDELVQWYVRGWATGISCRKPLPGFHPGVYQAQHGLSSPMADPFADYLRAGCPQGAWSLQVITPQPSPVKTQPQTQRVALHLHVFYSELLEGMLSRMKQNAVTPDLFISVPNEAIRQSVSQQVEDYAGKVVDIKVVPNRGRDIGPLLTAFGSEILANYDIVGHLHTKISADVKNAAVGEDWRYFLLENLLGGKSGAMADTILASMAADNSIGIVFPDDPYVMGWSENRSFGESLAEKLGINELPEYFNFPVGTMFWARVSVLRPLIELGLDWSDYPEEPLPYDGTLLHAIERILPFLNEGSATRCVVTNIPELSR